MWPYGACAMQIQLDGSGPVDMTEPPSFTLSQSGTFVKEDFVINRQGIAAVNGTEVTSAMRRRNRHDRPSK